MVRPITFVSLLLVFPVLFSMVAAGQSPARPKPGAVKGSSAKSTAAKPGAAKPAASAPQPLPIASLKVTGNKEYSQENVLSLAGLKLGDVAGIREFDSARDRLTASGFFETVGYQFDPAPGGKGYVASFDVKEIETYPYRFESLHVDENQLREHLRSTLPLFPNRLPGSKQALDQITKSINSFMAKQGRTDPVIAKLATIDAGKLEVVFQPERLPAVAEIDFRGNTDYSTTDLRAAVTGPGIGAIYTEPRFRQILDASVRNMYEAKGRLRVKFPKIEVVPAKGVEGLAVTVHIEEGDVYKLKTVALDQKPDDEVKLSPELLKEGGFALDQTADFTKISTGIKDIEQSLRRKGYLEVKSKMDRKIDDAAKTVDVSLAIDPGVQFTFRKLTIDGLDIQTEPHIRKLWAMKMGQPFNVEYPDFFLNRIREDGIFDNLGRTKSVVVPDAGTGTVDVVLIFEGEKPPKKPANP